MVEEVLPDDVRLTTQLARTVDDDVTVGQVARSFGYGRDGVLALLASASAANVARRQRTVPADGSPDEVQPQPTPR